MGWATYITREGGAWGRRGLGVSGVLFFALAFRIPNGIFLFTLTSRALTGLDLNGRSQLLSFNRHFLFTLTIFTKDYIQDRPHRAVLSEARHSEAHMTAPTRNPWLLHRHHARAEDSMQLREAAAMHAAAASARLLDACTPALRRSLVVGVADLRQMRDRCWAVAVRPGDKLFGCIREWRW